MVIMNDLEWQILSYYVIYYEKFRKVMQQTEKVALIYVLLVDTRETTNIPDDYSRWPAMLELSLLLN